MLQQMFLYPSTCDPSEMVFCRNTSNIHHYPLIHCTMTLIVNESSLSNSRGQTCHSFKVDSNITTSPSGHAMASRAIQDQQHGRRQDCDNLSPGTATLSNSQQLTVNFTVQDQQQENFSYMATCHQDPEPELDYQLELDLLWISGFLQVWKWLGQNITPRTRGNVPLDQQQANRRTIDSKPSSCYPTSHTLLFFLPFNWPSSPSNSQWPIFSGTILF